MCSSDLTGLVEIVELLSPDDFEVVVVNDEFDCVVVVPLEHATTNESKEIIIKSKTRFINNLFVIVFFPSLYIFYPTIPDLSIP